MFNDILTLLDKDKDTMYEISKLCDDNDECYLWLRNALNAIRRRLTIENDSWTIGYQCIIAIRNIVKYFKDGIDGSDDRDDDVFNAGLCMSSIYIVLRQAEILSSTDFENLDIFESTIDITQVEFNVETMNYWDLQTAQTIVDFLLGNSTCFNPTVFGIKSAMLIDKI